MRKQFEIISLIILTLHFVYTLVVFSSLPDTIPVHFNVAGEVDAFGSKVSIWAIWFASLGLFVMLSLFVYLPMQFWNLPEAVKQDSTGQGKAIALELISSLKVFTALLFFILTWLVVRSAKGHSVELLMIALLGVTIVPLVIVSVYINKMNQLQS